MRKEQFVNEEIYHIYNRGVDKRKIFLDKSDYYRFIHDLFEFNDNRPSPPANIRFNLRKPSGFSQNFNTQTMEIVIPREKPEGPRELLVEIMTWCLMPNHFHLFVRQLIDNGITQFMHKIGTGYTIYFNTKTERSGSLFQGTFKAIRVSDDDYFSYLPFYIHSNPLDLIEYGWRTKEIQNYNKAIKFLENYRYSSHLDYLGKKNFASVSQRKWLTGILGNSQEYKKQFYSWLKEMDRKELLEKDRGLKIALLE